MRRNTTPTWLRLGLVGAAVAVLAAGCGSSSSGSSSTASQSSSVASHTSVVNDANHPPPTKAATPLFHEPKVTVPSGPAPSHLEIEEIIKGTGPVAKPGDHVSVNYVGVLFKSHQKFEASWSRHEPLLFTLGEGHVIAGWEQGIAGMRLYGRRELIIPASLAYGPAGSPPTIPPNETLVFVVDLLNV